MFWEDFGDGDRDLDISYSSFPVNPLVKFLFQLLWAFPTLPLLSSLSWLVKEPVVVSRLSIPKLLCFILSRGLVTLADERSREASIVFSSARK
jgi:hypothetical protein